MIPDESPEVEVVETVDLVNVDIFVEVEARGVVLTLAADDTEEDVQVALSPDKARNLGEMLYKYGCDSAYGQPTTS